MAAKLTQRIQRVGPSPTLALTARAKAMRAEGIDVIGFGAGEPDFDTPDFIKEAAIQALQEGKTKYTPVGGIPELKQAIVDKLKRDNGLEYRADEILVSCGGKHSLYNIAQALFEAGDEVIIPSPYWVSYPDQVVLNDAKVVVIDASEANGFKVTPEQLEKAITDKTKAFILNSPSKPTGSAYHRDDLAALAKVRTKHGVYCISDEIYEKIVYAVYSDALQQNSTADGYRQQLQQLINLGILPGKTKPGFVNQSSGLKGVAGNLVGHSSGCKLAQFLVNQRQKLLSGFGVAFLDAVENDCQIAHPASLQYHLYWKMKAGNRGVGIS